MRNFEFYSDCTRKPLGGGKHKGLTEWSKIGFIPVVLVWRCTKGDKN